jgi:hypothetical protein
MTAAILSAVLLLQADPRLERVERLAGPVRRPLLWCPLAVTISSDAGFKGDVTAKSSFGFFVARRVELAPGGRRRLILPSIDPVEVAAGPSSVRVEAERSRAGFLAGVDARLPWSGEAAPSEKILFRKVEAEDLGELLEFGLMEAFDLLLLSDPAGLPLGAYGTTGKWVRGGTREEAVAAAEGLGDPPPRFGAVDVDPQRLWELAPRGGWVPAKRTHAVFFAVLYAFAGFVALVAAARRGPRAAAAAVAGTAAVFVVIFFLFFPRGQLWLVEHSCEVASGTGGAAEWRIWFAGSGTDVRSEIVFPRLVKPVFPTSTGADEPFTVRVEGRGCRVESLRIPAGRAVCFVAGGDRPPSMRPGTVLDLPLYHAAVVRDGKHRDVGDLAVGASLPAETPEGGPPPKDPEFTALGSRFVGGDAVYGWLDAVDRPARDVTSPALSDARVRPRFWVWNRK